MQMLNPEAVVEMHTWNMWMLSTPCSPVVQWCMYCMYATIHDYLQLATQKQKCHVVEAEECKAVVFLW